MTNFVTDGLVEQNGVEVLPVSLFDGLLLVVEHVHRALNSMVLIHLPLKV